MTITKNIASVAAPFAVPFLSLSSAPSAMASGEPVVEGLAYWNAALKRIEVYDGAQWAGIASGGGGGGASQLSDLDDVFALAPTQIGQVLYYNPNIGGGQWLTNTNYNIFRLEQLHRPGATEPTSRAGGEPLQAGDLFPDTSSGATLKIYDGAAWVGIAGGGGGGLASLADDATPELGGPLDVAGNAIVSTAGGDIVLTPDGGGAVILKGLTMPASDGTNGQVIATNGDGDLSFVNPAGGGDATYAVLGATTSGDGASRIGIEDAGGHITATTVEGALAEIAQAAAATVIDGGDATGN